MRIGIILTGDYSWAGGVYYSLNIIKLLQKLSLGKNIQIVVLVNKQTEKELLNEIRLKNVDIVSLDEKSFFYKVWCKFIGSITGTNFRFVSDINALKLDVLYPVIHYENSHENLKCRVFYWLFDFQHKFLPELFTKEELENRDLNFKQVTDHAKDIVVSSHNSKDHLMQFYPDCKAKVQVYNFASLTENLQKKLPLNMPQNYLVVCNQFWPHKNHLTVLKAIDLLVKKGKDVHLVFTGKYKGVKNEKYVKELQVFIQINKLEKHITFTGFIAREEQLALMENAKAVIQPSQFEGWSTVIEDAKALNKFIVASDLPIHREQLKEDVLFFKPDDALQLSEFISLLFSQKMQVTKMDYSANIRKSEADLAKIMGLT